MVLKADKGEVCARLASWNEKIGDWIPSFDGMTVERVVGDRKCERGPISISLEGSVG